LATEHGEFVATVAASVGVFVVDAVGAIAWLATFGKGGDERFFLSSFQCGDEFGDRRL